MQIQWHDFSKYLFQVQQGPIYNEKHHNLKWIIVLISLHNQISLQTQDIVSSLFWSWEQNDVNATSIVSSLILITLLCIDNIEELR